MAILLEELEPSASSAPGRPWAGTGSEGGVAERTRPRGKVLDDVEPEAEVEAEGEAGGGVPGRSQGSSFMPSW